MFRARFGREYRLDLVVDPFMYIRFPVRSGTCRDLLMLVLLYTEFILLATIFNSSAFLRG